MRFRYSIRLALGVTLVVGVALAWMRISIIGPLLRRAQAKSALTEKGVLLTDSWYEVPLPFADYATQHASSFVESGFVRAVHSVFRAPAEQDVIHISFRTSRRPATDDDVAALTAFAHLESLELPWWVPEPRLKPGTIKQGDSPHVTDRAMLTVLQLRKLQLLTADNCSITDAGCETLARHESIRLLSLDSNKITDRGLLALASCKTLKRVSVRSNTVTGPGLAKFRSLRPDVLVAN